MNYVYIEPNLVPPQLKGNYSGKAFKACAVTEYTVNGQDGVWDHGTRETHKLVRLSDGKEIPIIDSNLAPWDKARKDVKVTLESGFAIVRHSMFQGRDMGLTFYVHPDNIAAMLPKPVELTLPEKQLLYVTRSLKSSYRKEELQRNGFPMKDYESVLSALIQKGLLAKNKSITVAGRNAAESFGFQCPKA